MKAEDVAGLITCASVIVTVYVASMFWQFSRWSEIIPRLRTWSFRNDLELTSTRPYLPWDIFSSPIAPIAMGGRTYFRFIVRDREGEIRRGWVYIDGADLIIIWDSGDIQSSDADRFSSS